MSSAVCKKWEERAADKKQNTTMQNVNNGQSLAGVGRVLPRRLFSLHFSMERLTWEDLRIQRYATAASK